MKKRHILFILFILMLSLLIPQTLFTTINVNASSAECMVTIETQSKRVLYGHNIHKKRPMASVTKILTAITVLENCKDLNVKRRIPPAAVGIEGSSIYLSANEEISMLDLLYGLMLQSGNDCAMALALMTSGSVEEFSGLMNKTALKAGAKNSNFKNPHGLHDDQHYTSAYDLALITAYAMQNPAFKEIAATKKRTIERTNTTAPTVIINKNKILSIFKGGDGVKTGFTKKAGRCLVASATRDGMQVISVVLNCGPMFEDCSALMERAFKEYKKTMVAKAYEKIDDIKISGGKNPTAKAGTLKDIFYVLKDGESLEREIIITNDVSAPLKKGKEIGVINFKLQNQLLFTEKLYIIEDAPALKLEDYLEKILTEW